MNVLEFPGLMLVSKVNNHNLIKQTLLDQIAGMGVFGMINQQERLYNTDYYLPRDLARPYIDTAMPVFNDHNKQVDQLLDTPPSHGSMRVVNFWYQQYNTGDYQKWHSHPDSNLSNVYFVSLDQNNPRTTFKHLGKEFHVDVEEGMIITFPAYMQHCSPPNQSQNTKTVIAFNSQVDGK